MSSPTSTEDVKGDAKTTVLDLGCTTAMASRTSAQNLMEFCDNHPNCGLWYRMSETTSQFTFANSESAKRTQQLIVCMYDRAMRRFSCPCLRCETWNSSSNSTQRSPVLRVKHMKLRVAPERRSCLRKRQSFSGYSYEQEICYHTCTCGNSDFVEIAPQRGFVGSGLVVSETCAAWSGTTPKESSNSLLALLS